MKLTEAIETVTEIGIDIPEMITEKKQFFKVGNPGLVETYEADTQGELSRLLNAIQKIQDTKQMVSDADGFEKVVAKCILDAGFEDYDTIEEIRRAEERENIVKGAPIDAKATGVYCNECGDFSGFFGELAAIGSCQCGSDDRRVFELRPVGDITDQYFDDSPDYPEQWTQKPPEGGGLSDEAAKWLYSLLTDSKHDTDALFCNKKPPHPLLEDGFIKPTFCTGDRGGREFDGYEPCNVVFYRDILVMPDEEEIE